MANPTAKTTTSKPPKPQTVSASSTSSASAPVAKLNTGAKPNSLLGSTLAPVTAEKRRVMIEEAAYYIAQRRGFGQGRDLEDWLLAEKQIDATLSA